MDYEKLEPIAVGDCLVRGIYRIKSRNLTVGVFSASGWFTGIREKFHFEYLDAELHHDKGGTVVPLQLLDLELPDDISTDAIEGNRALFTFLLPVDRLICHKEAELFYTANSAQQWGRDRLGQLHDQEVDGG